MLFLKNIHLFKDFVSFFFLKYQRTIPPYSVNLLQICTPFHPIFGKTTTAAIKSYGNRVRHKLSSNFIQSGVFNFTFRRLHSHIRDVSSWSVWALPVLDSPFPIRTRYLRAVGQISGFWFHCKKPSDSVEDKNIFVRFGIFGSHVRG